MNRIKEALIYVYMAIIACASLYFAALAQDAPGKPACQLAEISPDFSTEQRQWCRMRRHKL